MIDRFIEKKKYCSRWISDKEANKIKIINEKVFIESLLGKVLVVINYFVCTKLVHTTGSEFIPNYNTEYSKYIVFLTWFTFAIMVLISIFQMLIKNKVYTTDDSLNKIEADYYKFKIFTRFVKLGVLVVFYITLYQIFFQLTMTNINIKAAILWWILILNLLIFMNLGFINTKGYIKREFIKNTLSKTLNEIRNGNYYKAKEKINEAREENAEIKSIDLEITINAIEEIILISEKENCTNMKSEKSKTELIANVSHDLKTPLTSIINYVNFLRKKELNANEVSAYIDILDRKSKSLKTLIDDLKESADINGKEVKLEKRNVKLDDILKESLLEFKEIINKSSLKFELVIGKDNDLIKESYVDVNKIMRVFHNLISNILKYSLGYSHVFIKLEQEESINFENGYYTRIIFKNISKDSINISGDEIVERFRRGDSSRNTEGSGLGLDIARSIVKVHGGDFNVNITNNEFVVDVII